jgi:hypothetical protein
MSWLEDRTYSFNYQCKTCEHVWSFEGKEKPYEGSFKSPCLEGESETDALEQDKICELEYVGFTSEPLNIMTTITYEKNGLQAVKTSDSRGNHSYKSVTKLNYEKNGNTKSVYTKEYSSHMAQKQSSEPPTRERVERVQQKYMEKK